jgi:hypothetical protein
MNWKGCGRRPSYSNLWYYNAIFQWNWGIPREVIITGVPAENRTGRLQNPSQNLIDTNYRLRIYVPMHACSPNYNRQLTQCAGETDKYTLVRTTLETWTRFSAGPCCTQHHTATKLSCIQIKSVTAQSAHGSDCGQSRNCFVTDCMKVCRFTAPDTKASQVY